MGNIPKFHYEIMRSHPTLREAAAHDAPLRACAVVPGTNGAGAGGGTQVLQERYGMCNQPEQPLAMFIPKSWGTLLTKKYLPRPMMAHVQSFA